jgi:hypothetical protein
MSPFFVLLAAARAALPEHPAWLAPRHHPSLTRAASVICLAELTLVAGRRLEVKAPEAEGHYLALAAPAADSALTAMGRGEGVAAVGPDFYLIQLVTRRAVLLETGAMDFLPYTPEAGPEAVRILHVLYASDYFRYSDRGLLDPEHIFQVWTARSTAEWRRVAREVGFREILVNNGWNLALPEIARSEWYVLYRIPD